MPRLMLRLAAAVLAGAAALLAVVSLGAEFEDFSALLGRVPGDSPYPRRAANAAAACGALDAERERCERFLLRLAPPTATRTAAHAGA